MNARLNHFSIPGIIICIFIACTPDIHETKSFRDIFDYYRDKEGVMAFSIPPSLIGLVLEQSDNDENELASLMKDLSAFRIISLQDTDIYQNTVDDLFVVVNDFTSRNDFNDFFVVRSSEENFIIKIKEDKDIIVETIMMFMEEGGLTVVNLRGNINPENITRLINSSMIQDIEELYTR